MKTNITLRLQFKLALEKENKIIPMKTVCILTKNLNYSGHIDFPCYTINDNKFDREDGKTIVDLGKEEVQVSAWGRRTITIKPGIIQQEEVNDIIIQNIKEYLTDFWNWEFVHDSDLHNKINAIRNEFLAKHTENQIEE